VDKAIINKNGNTYLLLYDKKIVANISTVNEFAINYFEKYVSQISRITNSTKRIDGIINGHYFGINLGIIPSNRCSLNCKYCYSQSGVVNENQFIDKNKIKIIIDMVFDNFCKFKSYFTRPINILFHGGGEPTFKWSDFKELVKYIKEKQKLLDVPLKLRLQTNGILSESQALWIATHFDEVGVSIDGIPQINDFMRPFPNDMPTTAISMSSAKIIAAYTKVGIHAVVTENSKGFGKNITNYFIENIPNLDYIHYEKYKFTEVGRNNALTISNQDFIDFLFDCIEAGNNIIRSSVIDTRIKKYYCNSCDGNMIYCFPNNRISLCNEHDSGQYLIGDYSDDIIINQEKYLENKKHIKDIFEKLQCEKCFAFPFCRGGCRSYYDQSYNYKEEWCNMLTKALLRYFEYKLRQPNLLQIVNTEQVIPYIQF